MVGFFGFVCHPEKHPQQAPGSSAVTLVILTVPFGGRFNPLAPSMPPLPTSLYLRGLCTSAMDLWSGRRNPWLVWVALHTPRHSNRSALGSHLLSMHGLSSRRPRRDCWPTRIKSLVSTQHGLATHRIGIEVVICMLPLLSRVATLDLVAPPVAMTGSASATHRSREPR